MKTLTMQGTLQVSFLEKVAFLHKALNDWCEVSMVPVVEQESGLPFNIGVNRCLSILLGASWLAMFCLQNNTDNISKAKLYPETAIRNVYFTKNSWNLELLQLFLTISVIPVCVVSGIFHTS